MQTKIKYHFTPTRLAKILKSENTRIMEDEEKQEFAYAVDLGINCSHFLENNYLVMNICLPFHLAILLLDISLEKYLIQVCECS